MTMRWYLCPCGAAWVGVEDTGQDERFQPVIWIKCNSGKCRVCRKPIGDFRFSKAQPPRVLRDKAAQRAVAAG